MSFNEFILSFGILLLSLAGLTSSYDFLFQNKYLFEIGIGLIIVFISISGVIFFIGMTFPSLIEKINKSTSKRFDYILSIFAFSLIAICFLGELFSIYFTVYSMSWYEFKNNPSGFGLSQIGSVIMTIIPLIFAYFYFISSKYDKKSK